MANQPLQLGALGEPLPDAENVFRLIRLSKDGKVSETAFTLSEKDKASPLKAVSIFAERLTTPRQAVAFLPTEKQAEYAHFAVLNVTAIRSLRPTPDSPAVSSLDVQWEPLMDEETGVTDSRPGATGHAGITGLERPAGDALPNAKLMYRSLRSQLADLANTTLQTIGG